MPVKNDPDLFEVQSAIGQPRQATRTGGNQSLMILQRNLSWIVIGAIGYALISSMARKQGLEQYLNPGTLMSLIAAAWLTDTQVPKYSRHLRDFTIGIFASRWLISLVSFLK